MTKYRLTTNPLSASPLVQRTADGATIPADPANADYRDFLDWKAAGNAPDPVPTPLPQVVLSVRPVALRWALRQTASPVKTSPNALTHIVTTLAATPAMADAAEAFEYAVECTRADLIALGTPLGFTVDMIDAVLAKAAARPGSNAVFGPAP